MPIFRWGHAWNAFQDLEREVDELFSSVDLTFQGIRLGRQYPAVNFYELSDEYLLTAEVPGTHSEDLELTIVGGILTLKGKRSDSEAVPDDRFRRHERFRGSWQRALSIPERVQEEKLSAEFKEGILKIHLPKADEIKPRHIPVIEGSE